MGDFLMGLIKVLDVIKYGLCIIIRHR